jgi:hypothetical protein
MKPNPFYVGRFERYRHRVRMSTADNQLRPDTVDQYNVIEVVYVIILVAYFLHFALPALGGGFDEDEIINIWTHWFSGVSKSVWANICFWKGIGRPAGAIYYLPLYHFFGMNPQPYRIAQMSILAGSIPIVYHLARLLSSSRSIAFLAVLAFCYHAKLANLLLGPFCYDVLCGFFYFAALTYYIHIREKGFRLRPIQWLGFLALYICALNAKEMAVTLPVVVFVYELLKYRRGVERPRFSRWILHYASPALLAGAITAIYCYNKVYGSGLVSNFSTELTEYRMNQARPDSWIIATLLEEYTPRYSWHRFIEANTRFVSELFYLAPKHVLSGEMLLAIWALLFVYAFLRRDRALQLMAFWVVITPLPLAFLMPRVGGRLYIPLFGWAMIFAKLVSDIITSMYKSLILLSQTVGWTSQLKQSSDGAANDHGRSALMHNTSPVTFQTLATLLVALALATFTQWKNQGFARVLNSEQKAVHVIQALRLLNMHPAPGSVILLRPEQQFYQTGYYPAYFGSLAQDNPLRQVVVELAPRYWYYLASLVWGDRTLRINVEGEHRLTEEQIAKMDYVISFDEFKARIVRGPPPG